MRYKIYALRSPRRIRRIIVAAPLLTLLILGLGIWFLPSSRPAVKQASLKVTVPTAKPGNQTIAGNYLFSGTVMLGRAVETVAHGNYEQPFSGMSTLGSYDANVGVLECPVTNNTVSYQTEVSKLIFNCKPQWLPTLKKYFPILSLSSDHLNDQGPSGYAETVNHLQTAGFQTVGNFNPHVEKDDCKVIILPARILTPGSQPNTGSLPVAFCSYNYKILFSPEPGELESIQKWSSIMPVVALMNGGPEYEHTAGSAQTDVAHKMIDFGASFVVGNGTHWAQNTEVYKGKLIVYSMGNFIFDQLDKDGRLALNLAVNMSLPYDANAAKWLSVGDSCKTSVNDCAVMAASQGLVPVTPNFSFSAIGSYGGYLQVAKKADAAQQAYIEQRANWAQTQHLLTLNSH
jgi:hypothetical protein